MKKINRSELINRLNLFNGDEVAFSKPAFGKPYKNPFYIPVEVAEKYVSESLMNTFSAKVLVSHLPWKGSSNTDNLFRRYRLILELIYLSMNGINPDEKCDIIECSFRDSRRRKYPESYGAKKIMDNRLEDYVTNRVKIIIEAGDQLIRDDNDAKIKEIVKISQEYMIVDCPDGCINICDMDSDQINKFILATIYLTTDIPYKKRMNTTFKCVLGEKKTVYNMVTKDAKKVSEYIMNHKNIAFEAWLDCRPFTSPDCTYETYYLYHAIQFAYMIMSDKCIHPNKFRIQDIVKSSYNGTNLSL